MKKGFIGRTQSVAFTNSKGNFISYWCPPTRPFFNLNRRKRSAVPRCKPRAQTDPFLELKNILDNIVINKIGILLPKLFWPTVRKKLFLWSRKTFDSSGLVFEVKLKESKQNWNELTLKVHGLLKYGSQEKVPFWCRCSIFLSLFMSKKHWWSKKCQHIYKSGMFSPWNSLIK